MTPDEANGTSGDGDGDDTWLDTACISTNELILAFRVIFFTTGGVAMDGSLENDFWCLMKESRPLDEPTAAGGGDRLKDADCDEDGMDDREG